MGLVETVLGEVGLLPQYVTLVLLSETA